MGGFLMLATTQNCFILASTNVKGWHEMKQDGTAPAFDPTQAAMQVGFRKISFTIPEAHTATTLHAWTIIFQQHPISRARYRKLEFLFGQVDSHGFLPETVAGVSGRRASSMSERNDLIGEYATIWVTSDDVDAPERGAVLAGLNGVVIHLMAIDPIVSAGNESPAQMLDEIGRNIAARVPEMLMAHEVDEEQTVARLPQPEDLPAFAGDIQIVEDRYDLLAP